MGGMIHRFVPVSTTWLPLFKEMQGWRIILGFNKEIYCSQHSSPPLAAGLSRDIQLCELFFLRWRVSHKPTIMHEQLSHWQFFNSVFFLPSPASYGFLGWDVKIESSRILLLARFRAKLKLVFARGDIWICICFVVSGGWPNRRCSWSPCLGSTSSCLHSSLSKWRLSWGLFSTWFWALFR